VWRASAACSVAMLNYGQQVGAPRSERGTMEEADNA
jgi:hypothetical protein